MATLKPAIQGPSDILALFKASLCQDSDCLNEIAATLGADPEAFQAVMALAPVPFLHACNRRWTHAIAQSWAEGYCPVCGAWPRSLVRHRQGISVVAAARVSGNSIV
jgi:hypothetical protein